MDPYLFSRADALRAGLTVSSLDTKIRRGSIERLARSLYAVSTPQDRDELWRRELRVLLGRSAIPSAVCGVSAALLHKLDGFEPGYYSERRLSVVTPVQAHIRDPAVRRSRTFDPARRVLVDSIPVTNLVDTIADLGRDVSLDQLEIALDSVLRGDEPKRPDIWHSERLAELQDMVSTHPRVPGRAELAVVLRRRGVVLPTGSAAETKAVIALRGANITLQRQVRVRIFDGRRRLRYTYWLDFGDIGRRVALEIDGRLGHGTADRIQRDYRRDNILNSVFVIVRFSATDVNNDVGTLVRDMQRRLSETSPTLGPFRTERGLQVTPTNLGVDVVDRMF